MDENKVIQKVQTAVPQVTKEDFLNCIAQSLGTYKWPKGAIESINANKTKLVYLWGNRLKGTADGTWYAKVNGTHKIKVNNKDSDIPDGTPYSGTFPKVEFDLLIINENQATPYWAQEFCKIGFESDNFQPESSITAAGGIIEGENSGNPLTSWMKNGNEIVDNFLLPVASDLSRNTAIAYLALNILPAEVIQQSMNIFNRSDFNSRDVSVSSRNSVTEEPTPVLIPFYVLEFEFEGQAYHFAMMADKHGTIKGKVPPVKGQDKTPEQIVEEEMPDKAKKVRMMKWGWILAILLLFVVNLAVALVYLVAWGIGYWFLKKPINNRISELAKQEADDSRKTAELLKKQLTK